MSKSGTIPKFVKLIAGLLLTASLSGCFTSSISLISPQMAVFPANVITYTVTNDNGTTSDFQLVRHGDEYIQSLSSREPIAIRFMSAGSGQYVAQAEDKTSTGNQYLYAFLVPDAAIHKVYSYKAIADPGADVALPKGLRICDNNTVCIDTVASYIQYARSAIASNEAPSISYSYSLMDKETPAPLASTIATDVPIAEAQQALQLLTLALKTATPMYQQPDAGQHSETVYQHRYLGNLRIFASEQVETTLSFTGATTNAPAAATGASGTKVSYTDTADFADIGSAQIDDQGVLTLTCRDNKKCISVVFRHFQNCGRPTSSDCVADDVNFKVLSEPVTGNDPQFNTEQSGTVVQIGHLADLRTAKNAKLAIDLLVRYNQAQATQNDSTSFRIKVPDWSVLNLRGGAGTDQKLVAAIPSAAQGLIVSSCIAVPGYNNKWCQANWGGIIGWASASGLVSEAGGNAIK